MVARNTTPILQNLIPPIGTFKVVRYFDKRGLQHLTNLLALVILAKRGRFHRKISGGNMYISVRCVFV